jgi:hypothetical protein
MQLSCHLFIARWLFKKYFLLTRTRAHGLSLFFPYQSTCETLFQHLLWTFWRLFSVLGMVHRMMLFGVFCTLDASGTRQIRCILKWFQGRYLSIKTLTIYGNTYSHLRWDQTDLRFRWYFQKLVLIFFDQFYRDFPGACRNSMGKKSLESAYRQGNCSYYSSYCFNEFFLHTVNIWNGHNLGVLFLTCIH